MIKGYRLVQVAIRLILSVWVMILLRRGRFLGGECFLSCRFPPDYLWKVKVVRSLELSMLMLSVF